MLTALLGGTEFPTEYLQFIRDKADGNPLFIEEVTQRCWSAGCSSATAGPAAGHRRPQRSSGPPHPRHHPGARRPARRAGEGDGADRGRHRPASSSSPPRAHVDAGSIADRRDLRRRLDIIHEACFFRSSNTVRRVILRVIYRACGRRRRQLVHGCSDAHRGCLYADQLEEHAVVLAQGSSNWRPMTASICTVSFTGSSSGRRAPG